MIFVHLSDFHKMRFVREISGGAQVLNVDSHYLHGNQGTTVI